MEGHSTCEKWDCFLLHARTSHQYCDCGSASNPSCSWNMLVEAVSISYQRGYYQPPQLSIAAGPPPTLSNYWIVKGLRKRCRKHFPTTIVQWLLSHYGGEGRDQVLNFFSIFLRIHQVHLCDVVMQSEVGSRHVIKGLFLLHVPHPIIISTVGKHQPPLAIWIVRGSRTGL